MDFLKAFGWFCLFLPLLVQAQTLTPVLALAVSADNTQLATGTLDGLLRVRDLATGEELYRQLLQGHEGIATLEFETLDSILIEARDGSFWRWRVSSGRLQSATARETTERKKEALSPNKTLTARLDQNGLLRVIELVSGKLVAESAVGEARTMIWTAFGILLLYDQALVLRTTRLEKLWSLSLPSRPSAVAVQGVHWAVALFDGQILAGESDGQSTVIWKAHSSAINAVAWADDHRLVTAGADSIVSIWSYPGAKVLGKVLP
jgi:hypothetical protein